MTLTTHDRDAARRKRQFLAKIVRCPLIQAELKTAALIFDHLNSLSGYEIAWPSEETLATASGKNVRTIKQHVTCLQAVGVITVRKMGGAEFRAWARETYDLTVKATATPHLMNVYQPCWDSPLAKTGQPSDEQAEHLKLLRSSRRRGKAASTSNKVTGANIQTRLNGGTRGKSNSGTGGTLNSGTRAPLSGRGKGAAGAPFPGDVEESNLGPASGPPADQTDMSSPGGRGITPNPSRPHAPEPAKPPSLPVTNPEGFLRFTRRWEELARCQPSWSPLDAAGRTLWAQEWDTEEIFKEEGFGDCLLDRVCANPYLVGRKAGAGGQFRMQPTYLLGPDKHTGHKRYLLVASKQYPYHDFAEDIQTRVSQFLMMKLPEAELPASGLFWVHEQPRALDLLREEVSRREADAARREAARLTSADAESVRYRLGQLAYCGYEPIEEHLDEFIDGLLNCPAPGGRELIVDALWYQLSTFGRWEECRGRGDRLRDALLGLPGNGRAEAIIGELSGRFLVGRDVLAAMLVLGDEDNDSSGDVAYDLELAGLLAQFED